MLDRHRLRTFTHRVEYVEGLCPKTFAGRLNAFLDTAPKDRPWFSWLGFSDLHHVWDTNASA